MKNLIPTLRYAWLTVKHKTFVFQAGLKTKAPLWRLLVHDLSKFGPAELPHYGRQFFGDKSDPVGFEQAWNHHQKCNKHHWEYWIPHTKHGRGGWEDHKPLPMPEHYVREMIADWMGATRAYSGFLPTSCGDWPWLLENLPKMKLHPATLTEVILVFEEIGFWPGGAFHFKGSPEWFAVEVEARVLPV